MIPSRRVKWTNSRNAGEPQLVTSRPSPGWLLRCRGAPNILNTRLCFLRAGFLLACAVSEYTWRLGANAKTVALLLLLAARARDLPTPRQSRDLRLLLQRSRARGQGP